MVSTAFQKDESSGSVEDGLEERNAETGRWVKRPLQQMQQRLLAVGLERRGRMKSNLTGRTPDVGMLDCGEEGGRVQECHMF